MMRASRTRGAATLRHSQNLASHGQLQHHQAVLALRLKSTEAPSRPRLQRRDTPNLANLSAKELRTDVKRLGRILGGIIKEEDEKVYEHVESMRHLAKDFRRGSSQEAFDQMVKTATELSPQEAKDVARSFSHFLALSNCAETHHRVREIEELRRGQDVPSPFPPKMDSSRGAIKALLEEEKLSPREVRDTLLKQRVELVLTAHPTEINRRTVIEKHRRITRFLEASDRLDRLNEGPPEHSYERRELEDSLKREVASLWSSDQIRRSKPTPFVEAQGGLAVIESVLWTAVPTYLRKLDAELVRALGEQGLPAEEAGLPLDAAPIRFASWMGGDRDGNPNVSAKTTLQVAALHRWQAATLYVRDLEELYIELSMSTGFSNEVQDLAEEIHNSLDSTELYRRIIGDLRRRLLATAQRAEKNLRGADFTPTHSSTNPAKEVDAKPLESAEELMKPLKAIHESLQASGRSVIANGRLADTIRRVAVFGLTIMPLDIRQESTRHLEAVDAITRHLGLGAYAQWDEDTKINWLCQELSTSRPLLPHQVLSDFSNCGFSDTVIDTLETFRAASRLGEGSLGAYVISQAQKTSDVLAVALLQQEFGMVAPPAAAGEGGNVPSKMGVKPMMRVVPLFETLNDLNNAPQVMRRLLNLPAYVGRISNRQEIMVGYSDSAKDAGRLAACWAQYRCQEQLVQVAKDLGDVELTFFHGKGGTVGRGGNPAVYRAVLSHPPNTIDGRFRVTEQGEMITQNFGDPSIAQRILDIYTAAVLREKHYKHVQPSAEWRSTMDAISDTSCDRYRKMVREEPTFVPYFRTVTPELELGALNVGSRPSKRNPKGGVESLRAIPWIFAWSQTRCHLPAWLGVGAGLSTDGSLGHLQTMYKEWPWFGEILDLIAMILSKSDPPIAANYDKQLIPGASDDDSVKKDMVELGESIRGSLKRTCNKVLEISGHDDLNMGNEILQRELEVRAPYLDALNVIQCELMRRLRQQEYASPEEEAALRDALLITINGIAAGLRNSG
ncbi:Phosphoenolpyruvate carboxylase [Hondaea fermentalgiana]|uniref:phosphoenolpyruvate carboxylase n=1 Tax=Hondaea fermentalgiana TaxID=2315210 RepID=A0A2R5H0N8_9STRA|nr:Phosphoenolpyruvate carboxylase [Hondaea fermentalgiana]|eukprot:GBG34623.1 Phosphoenolpyruvate carboxylase [Hondaea fermentalgiana]